MDYIFIELCPNAKFGAEFQAFKDSCFARESDKNFVELDDMTPELVKTEIADAASRLQLKNYVIITEHPQRYVQQFISNNVIDPIGKDDKQLINEIEWVLSNFGKDKPMTSNTFFISDTHFFHANIIKYCNRPYADVDEMNASMIKKWNKTVGKDDIVWHLGDFCFGKKENVVEVLPKLNGRINLVMGNHDHQKVKFYMDAGFHRVYDRPVLVNGFVILSHAPLQFLNENCPFFNIYGHVHDSLNYMTYTKNSLCACVERWGYRPISWTEVNDIYQELNYD